MNEEIINLAIFRILRIFGKPVMPAFAIVAEGVHPKDKAGKGHIEHMSMGWFISRKLNERMDSWIFFRDISESMPFVAGIRSPESKFNRRAADFVNDLGRFDQTRFLRELVTCTKRLRPN